MAMYIPSLDENDRERDRRFGELGNSQEMMMDNMERRRLLARDMRLRIRTAKTDEDRALWEECARGVENMPV